MAMAVGGKKGGVTSDINVTPLCDVMLVLLIIFMVITPMLQKGVDVKLPEAEFPTDHPDNEDSVTVAMRLDRTIYLNMVPVPEVELVAKVRELYENRADKTIFLKADEGLEYGDVLKLMELCRNGGVEEVGMITEVKTGP
jgi:biopolymer transport protein ExbD